MTKAPADIVAKAEALCKHLEAMPSEGNISAIAEVMTTLRRDERERGNEELRLACLREIDAKTAELKASLAETLEIAKRNEIGPYVHRARKALFT